MPSNHQSIEQCAMNSDPGDRVQVATFDAYQTLAARTHRDDRSPQFHLGNYALGVAGEAGEVADMIKKHLYHGQPLDVDALAKEMGDVLWYLAGLATVIGVPLGVIATANIRKLRARHPGAGWDPAYHTHEERHASAYAAGAASVNNVTSDGE